MNGNTSLKNKLSTEESMKFISYLYGTLTIEETRNYSQRFLDVIIQFEELFGENNIVRLFSAPGRTEVGGNHTDHQHGKVLAASVNMDMIAAVSKNNTNTINIKSDGHDMIHMDINNLSINQEEYNTTLSLIKGIVYSFVNLGYSVYGFDAYITSNVLKGSGLSSSAAFEVLIGTIINCLFCNGNETAVKIAQIGQYSENIYFGKPSGLMDQTASSVGGFVSIDFNDNNNPIVQKIDFDFSSCGYSLCIIDTGGSHADLTPDYAAVPVEMKSVAQFFGKSVLTEVDETKFYSNIASIRKKCGDRAVIRAIHFYLDNSIVPKEVEALNNHDFEEFKNLIIASGKSSFMYLQNVYSCSNPQEQGVPLALALCERLLDGKGAYRVHGGGFAGTVQAFVPISMLDLFRTQMETIFGENKCHVLSIRPVGGIELFQNN